ncbi:hypothetical protein BZB76_5439 [Actinomadura pelletieri DSM 43383]|uniref:Uncharacterized protein n=1 Tax=Actinomadura pelletieri DSM 43383 TaxID=1120940 RepID=A0A495QGI6_9ACTN|nr:hypothetical protein [Actinomadura pelletieri]RKS70959.1 hypothetical protein BZB76_5439 [Actinomadura pelletieri DSM 43383]
MTHRPFYPAGHEDIFEDFRQFRADCGKPDSSSVLDNVARLEQLFPLKHGRKSVPRTLSKSAMSQFFTGSKGTLPAAGITAALILGHLRCAVENGSIRSDPETGTPHDWECILEAWQARLRQAKRQNRPEPPLPRHGGRQDAGTSSTATGTAEPSGSGGATAPVVPPGPVEGGSRLAVMPTASPPVPPGTTRHTDPVHLTPDESAALVAHGDYGLVLAEHARIGDPEALYQLAVALALDPDHCARAQAWLVSATAARHPAAAGLVPEPGRSIDVHDARARAKELARRAEGCGHEAALEFFLSCVQQAALRAVPIAAEGDEPR